MAVLGSTVDPRLGAVSPAAIQALSQAGAATGQMYANIGGSIAGVIQDFKSKKDDSSLQQAYLDSLQIDDDGNQKVDRKAFLQKAKDNKVPSKLANAYLKNELEISSMQNQMDIQNKMADLEAERLKYEGQRVGLEGRRVGIAEEAEKRMADQFADEMEFKTEEQRLRVSQWATQNLTKMQELNALREANKITKERYDKDYELAVKRANNELEKLEISKDLTKAQIEALNAETLFKKAETGLTQAEIDSYKDTDIGLGSEETMNNKLVGVLGIADRATAWDPLSAADKASFIRDRLDYARQRGANMTSERMKDLQRSYDFFYEDALLKGMPISETAATSTSGATGNSMVDKVRKADQQFSDFTKSLSNKDYRPYGY
jgi:hypothetical protein